MVEIKPFKGIEYNKDKVDDMEEIITQPYDKINDELRNKYYKNSEYNYCRLILPKEENRYEKAKERLNNWLRESILRKRSKPGIYVYMQDFEVLGKKHTRKGFVSAVKLHPFEEEIVLPHEETHKGPKIDRLNMLRSTEKNLEAGFMLYSDPEKTSIDLFEDVTDKEPLFEATDEYGVHSRVWRVEDERHIKTIEKVLEGEQIVIADGHHRYETAVNFRDELRAKNPEWQESDAFNWRMTYMVPVEDSGLVVLPGHRLLLKHELKNEDIEKLKEYFETYQVEINEAEGFLEENKDTISFVVYDGDCTLGLRLRDKSDIEKFLSEDYSEDYKNLDVVVLRDVIFEGIMGASDLDIDVTIAYERWSDDAVERVNKGDATVAFLVNATKPEQVLKVAKNGERMPENSTDFYPKVNSGFMMMDIEPGEKL